MLSKEMTANHFEMNTSKYTISKVYADKEDLKTLYEMVNGNKNEQLLDIGTGSVDVANTLAPLFEKVTAFIPTTKMLDTGKRFTNSSGYQNITFIKGEVSMLPFTSNKFDAVTSRMAPHHFRHIEKLVSETARVLKEGGMFYLIDSVVSELNEYDAFYNYIEKKRDPSHYRAYKKTEWISLLERNGFQIEFLLTFKKEFLFDEWCDRMNLTLKEKRDLNRLMIVAPDHLIKFFSIVIESSEVQSFQGETMFLAVRKEREILV
ncbi:methyltransferase domain-containing protein [Domibacillus sp. DTU_2020_1001157_1_SI_ALB_TIR_016]|uniref:class I SAM-dependent methyltransferase n=1 Tax=Domibacillus sp. DTU_2020_1001157_1_SI_ALB_TIR_016 TaxID=3077789 RepID=UPI0028E7FF7F|nr:methyltransferase domain-containing protein [Domibacillus sp. DTU_2020_1001157_1_SI_ALB_TIR_016]WNS78634.1 methyltransferase domain-containing protein [Domibacillus sp. DTU_2020_1001157_1_SI_ALB_TIR_016]